MVVLNNQQHWFYHGKKVLIYIKSDGKISEIANIVTNVFKATPKDIV